MKQNYLIKAKPAKDWLFMTGCHPNFEFISE